MIYVCSLTCQNAKNYNWSVHYFLSNDITSSLNDFACF